MPCSRYLNATVKGTLKAGAASLLGGRLGKIEIRGSEIILGEPTKFRGHPISLDFKDGDLIDLFRLMSEISGLNIIVNPGISGKVSLTGSAWRAG